MHPSLPKPVKPSLPRPSTSASTPDRAKAAGVFRDRLLRRLPVPASLFSPPSAFRRPSGSLETLRPRFRCPSFRKARRVKCPAQNNLGIEEPCQTEVLQRNRPDFSIPSRTSRARSSPAPTAKSLFRTEATPYAMTPSIPTMAPATAGPAAQRSHWDKSGGGETRHEPVELSVKSLSSKHLPSITVVCQPVRDRSRC
jgi:hypothetical protein